MEREIHAVIEAFNGEYALKEYKYDDGHFVGTSPMSVPEKIVIRQAEDMARMTDSSKLEITIKLHK